MRQRTQLINALRAHMAELGIVAAQGREGVKELLKMIATEQEHACWLMLIRASSCWRGASGAGDDDQMDREADHCSASLGRSKQAAQENLGLALWVRPESLLRPGPKAPIGS